MKTFNTTGVCFPEKNYMVDVSHTVDRMTKMVERGDYFTINRGRQYGKTTTLLALKKKLENIGYVVFSISFEGLEDDAYKDAGTFYKAFCDLLFECIYYKRVNGLSKDKEKQIKNVLNLNMPSMKKTQLGMFCTELCNLCGGRVVLLIDEVDQAGNYEAFLKFLGFLRDKYLIRNEVPTFQSVILAGVYDIKNLKLKIRSEEEHQYNSPWNVAVGYTEDMSLMEAGIAGMLCEYEADHATGMDVESMARLLREYTSGYPYLVSRLCQLMDDDKMEDAWSRMGFQRAVKALLGEGNTLFDDMIKKLDQYPKLHDMLYEILYYGRKVAFDRYDREISIAMMFGYIYDKNGVVAISNRILGMRLYNLFVTEASKKSDEMYVSGSMDKNQFVKDGVLDMALILERFAVHYTELYGNCNEKFHEKEGRKFFLFYLKPIINGTGNCYVETETSDEKRMDVVVDYLGKQYVVELKIWRGSAYHEEGEHQLADYLEQMHLEQGYMLTFNFNQKKYPGVKETLVAGKRIWEAVV